MRDRIGAPESPNERSPMPLVPSPVNTDQPFIRTTGGGTSGISVALRKGENVCSLTPLKKDFEPCAGTAILEDSFLTGVLPDGRE